MFLFGFFLYFIKIPSYDKDISLDVEVSLLRSPPLQVPSLPFIQGITIPMKFIY